MKKHLFLILFCSSFVSAFAADAVYPSDILHLVNWKITLPEDINPADNKADEVKQLIDYKHDNYFFLTPEKDGVVFRAHAGGATTNNSGYPRSELRERKSDGSLDISWDSNDGNYHVMEIRQKITHLPEVKKHVVAAQIHDANDDVCMLRLEGQKLFLEFGNKDADLSIDPNYQLGTAFNFKVIVHNNVMQFYYNDELKHTKTLSFSGAYFKAGVYTQSSCQGSKKVQGEECDAYGEVIIYSLSVYHGDTLLVTNIDKTTTSAEIAAYYNILGTQLANEPKSGIYVVLYKNGKTKKMIK